MPKLEVDDALTRLLQQDASLVGGPHVDHKQVPILLEVHLPTAQKLFGSVVAGESHRKDAGAVLTSKLGGCALGDDPSMVDDAHRVGRLRLLHVVGREEDSRSLKLPKLSNRAPDMIAGLRVEPGGGLIEEDHGRPMDERASNIHAALLTTGRPPIATVEELFHVEQIGEVIDASATLGSGQVTHDRASVQVFPRRQQGIEQRILEHHADPAPDLRIVAPKAKIIDQHQP